MTTDIKKRGLGRGLDALFQAAREEDASFAPKIRRADEIVAAALAQPAGEGGARKIAIGKLIPGKFQPRRHFDDAALDSLAESISVHGVLQPLLVRPLTSDTYEIVAGERRWRAAQKAQVHELPVVIQNLDDSAALEIALIENLQRENLSALEEAEGYQRLMDEFHHTQDVLAQQLGKSRSHVANMLRLLKLPNKVKKYMQEGSLSAGHARALIGCANAETVAAAVIKRGLNVRQTEKLVQAQGAAAGSASKARGVKKTALHPTLKNFFWKDVDVLALEEKMSTLLGLRVTIESIGGIGSLRIDYKTLEQLDAVLERLSQTPKKY